MPAPFYGACCVGNEWISGNSKKNNLPDIGGSKSPIHHNGTPLPRATDHYPLLATPFLELPHCFVGELTLDDAPLTLNEGSEVIIDKLVAEGSDVTIDNLHQGGVYITESILRTNGIVITILSHTHLPPSFFAHTKTYWLTMLWLM